MTTIFLSAEARRAQVLRVLGDRAMTISELGKAMHLAKSSVWNHVEKLHGMRKVYVSGFSGPRGTGKMFSAGDKDDVLHACEVELEGEARPLVIVNVRRDPLDVALFGEYRRAA